MVTDDISAHKWAHAYTDSTHGLFYQWQSGALNEAHSDIFGEVIDLLNGRGDDDHSTMRSDDSCSVYGGSTASRLTVDGGTFDGVEVEAIGLTKATHIWFGKTSERRSYESTRPFMVAILRATRSAISRDCS